jgi:molybdate transport system permease protein
MQQVAQSQAVPQAISRPRGGSRRTDTAFWCVVPTSLLMGFIVLLLAALVWRTALDPTLWASLTKPMVLDALWVTGLTASATLLLALVVGTPLAYLLARRQFPGKWLVETVTDLPLVLPPVTAGVALLMAFGRRGMLGSSLIVLGIELPFTMTAVVLAQLFVAGSFYIRGAKLGLAAVTQEVEEAAAVDGASA